MDIWTGYPNTARYLLPCPANFGSGRITRLMPGPVIFNFRRASVWTIISELIKVIGLRLPGSARSRRLRADSRRLLIRKPSMIVQWFALLDKSKRFIDNINETTAQRFRRPLSSESMIIAIVHCSFIMMNSTRCLFKKVISGKYPNPDEF